MNSKEDIKSSSNTNLNSNENNAFTIDLDKIENKKAKVALAKKVLDKVKDGQAIGFGSGTTSYITAIEIGEKVQKEHLNIIAVPTSNEIKSVCEKYGIKIGNLIENELDWAFDGADEVELKEKWLIKGKGKAMFKEKLNIIASPKTYILVDNTKIVDYLGQKCKVPIEVFPQALKYVSSELEKLGAKDITYRGFTENSNGILDVRFEKIEKSLEKQVKSITGVIESGLFLEYKNIEILSV